MGSGDAAAGTGSQSNLADLTSVDLGSLAGLDSDESAFGHSIRRILDDAGRPQDVVAGWNSAL
jgi:FXSXX-COOH protein